MNKYGEVRSASEFKDIFEDTGESYRPYCCPFCEVLYEDRCIITECVKAPHFKLPDGTVHREGCNGEAGSEESLSVATPSKAPKRTVVGGIELPEALVGRRKAQPVRTPDDEGKGLRPDAIEVARRRRLVAADKTILSHYTTSLLRAIIHGYRRLKKHAYTEAIAAKLEKGSTEYNKFFREMLSQHRLSLYGQKLTYGTAFQGSKLAPWHIERVYSGSGQIRVEVDHLVIKDIDSWPKESKSKELVPFEVKLMRELPPDAPTSHLKVLEALEGIAVTGQTIEWHAYGLPLLRGTQFELSIDLLDHFYFEVR